MLTKNTIEYISDCAISFDVQLDFDLLILKATDKDQAWFNKTCTKCAIWSISPTTPHQKFMNYYKDLVIKYERKVVDRAQQIINRKTKKLINNLD